MKFNYFIFENFKGIKNQTLDLSKNPENRVFTLVGLNESGKTTVLEAINYFFYKSETLNALGLDNYNVTDIHNLIPINKRDNFNGKILITAGIGLDGEDVKEIQAEFRRKGVEVSDIPSEVTYTQTYHFENSIHQVDKNRYTWDHGFKKWSADKQEIIPLENEQAVIAHPIILKRLPSILYFPNFLFEFPEKIYLNDTEDAKHKFYQVIIQDVLDSLDNGTNIKDHLIRRIESNDPKESRNLASLIGKMEKQLTVVVFQKWNQILNKELSKTDIVLYYGKDAKGSYLEFNIKDNVDTYSISERSLGFRWFFVYILLTQFRTYRKSNKNVLFLFDEPASNLHPSAQTELLKSFEKLPKVIYTTHSHYLVNPKWLENTFVIKNEAIDYEDETLYNSRNTNIKIYKYRNFAVKHPNQTTYFQPILQVLDYRPTNLEMVPKAIITEGKNDYYTYNYLQTLLNNDEYLSFIPGTSSSNLESLISLYLGWARPFLILLDSDKEGIKQKKRYIEVFGDSISNKVFTYQDIDPDWTDKQTEDFFIEEDRLSVQKLKYSPADKYSKTLFNQSIQELYIRNEIINVNDDTKNNFKKVLLFLKNKLG